MGADGTDDPGADREGRFRRVVEKHAVMEPEEDPRPRDPIQAAAEPGEDLYGVVTWEERSWLDRAICSTYEALHGHGWVILIALAGLLFLAELGLAVVALAVRPTLGVLALLSIAPALALAGYIWYGDPTIREPWELLAGTFLLGVVFATLAAVVNTIMKPLFLLVPILGIALFFFLVVGPVEETVKWLAVRVLPYRDARFNTVVDGAVYGAAAGLGFAAIENVIYILNAVVQAQPDANVLQVATGMAAVRAFAGPGHVIYSGIAGYYLGMAKFNPDDAGPIAVKGLVIAALLHATYNTLVTYLPAVGLGTIGGELGLLAVILLYDGAILTFLLVKIHRYRSRYQQLRHDRPAAVEG